MPPKERYTSEVFGTLKASELNSNILDLSSEILNLKADSISGVSNYVDCTTVDREKFNKYITLEKAFCSAMIRIKTNLKLRSDESRRLDLEAEAYKARLKGLEEIERL